MEELVRVDNTGCQVVRDRKKVGNPELSSSSSRAFSVVRFTTEQISGVC